MKHPLLSSIFFLALSSSIAAQNCSDNTYPITLVDAYGVPATTTPDPQYGFPVHQFANEDVYVAFDPNMPSGTYYVHVTDPVNGIADMVLSTNDPMDRFVQITNNGGGNITLSLPMSANAPVTGLGLGGVGQSLLLQPFTNSSVEPCQFKAWCGDWWDLSSGPANPYMIQGGLNPNTMTCAVRSYAHFEIGDGTPADLSGLVFSDTNQNGEQDTGEAGLPGWTVNLVTNGVSVSTVTGNDGSYTFPNIACAEYTVELTMQSAFVATTPVVYQIESCGCADVEVAPFGVVANCLPCDGHTKGYWGNCNGLQKVQQYGILSTLPALGIVNACGQRVAPGTLWQFDHYLQQANSTNMAYMLSAQLVAMHSNVIAGFVDVNCVIEEPGLGQITIGDLMQRAVLSLWAHPFTNWCSPHRAEQALLKNALDHANNNQNWVNACSCNNGSCGNNGGSCGGNNQGGSCGNNHHNRRSPYRRRHHC